MRRALAWTAGIVGIAALARWLRRRGPEVAASVAEPIADPAGELRRALEESRAPEAPAEPPGAPKAPVEQAVTPAGEDASVEDRRADVHARAESAISRMREGDG